MGGGGEVKTLLVLRREATNVLERAVAFLFSNGIQLIYMPTFCQHMITYWQDMRKFYPNITYLSNYYLEMKKQQKVTHIFRVNGAKFLLVSMIDL